MEMNFLIILFFFALIGGLLLLKKTWPGEQPHLNLPSLEALRSTSSLIPALPSIFLWGSVILFIFALANPRIYEEKKDRSPPTATEGIAIYLVLDQSGSMTEEIVTYTATGAREKTDKLNLTKSITQEFVKNRPHDLIGLLSFARGAEIHSPLTLDHPLVLDRLESVTQVSDPEMDGTAIGYAIYKTVNLIEATRQASQKLGSRDIPSYEMKSAVMILVTDGLQDPNPLDKGDKTRTVGLEEAAKYAKKHNVKLYMINVEPRIQSEKYAPNRRQMERITELTGGRFYLIDHSQTLSSVYEDIDQLEKASLPALSKLPKTYQPERYNEILLSPFLITGGMLLLLVAILLKTLGIRSIP